MEPIRDMWQHMIGEKSKADGLANRGVDMWQKVLSKFDFRPNNSIGREGRREREKREKA